MRKVLNEGGCVGIRVIEECVEEDLNAREIYWIETMRGSFANLTNSKSGGEGGRHSDATKAKISKSRTGLKLSAPMSEQARQALSKAHTGKKWTEDQRQRHSERMRGNRAGVERTDAERAAISRGKCKLSDDKVTTLYCRAKNSESRKVLAEEFGVSVSLIERLVALKTYTHLNLKDLTCSSVTTRS